MAARLHIGADLREAKRFVALIGRGGVNRAAARAINHTLGPARTASVDALATRRNLTKGEIRKTLRTERATPQRLEGAIVSSGHRIPLHRYRGTRISRRPPGVRVEIVKGRRHVLPSPYFVMPAKQRFTGATLGAGGFSLGTFEAVPGKRPVMRRLLKSRLPIELVTGPSIPSALATPIVESAVTRAIDGRFRKRLDHELAREIDQARRRALVGRR